MTDRELLERAARAAGYGFDGNLKHDRYSSNIWDPLYDDGDAFRLMVDLNLLSGWSFTQEIRDICDDGVSLRSVRRAIVRAAAAMVEDKS